MLASKWCRAGKTKPHPREQGRGLREGGRGSFFFFFKVMQHSFIIHLILNKIGYVKDQNVIVLLC